MVGSSAGVIMALPVLGQQATVPVPRRRSGGPETGADMGHSGMNMATVHIERGVTETARHRTAWIAAGPEHGPLMIFIHGCPGLSITWRPQIEQFASEGWRCIALVLTLITDLHNLRRSVHRHVHLLLIFHVHLRSVGQRIGAWGTSHRSVPCRRNPRGKFIHVTQKGGHLPHLLFIENLLLCGHSTQAYAVLDHEGVLAFRHVWRILNELRHPRIKRVG